MSSRNRLIRASSLIVLGLFCGQPASADSWTFVAPMPTPRYSFGAATGSDGGIYAIGGTQDNSTALSVVEKYTPSTNTWQSVASLPTPLFGLAATAGLDGRIYAIGGYTGTMISGVVQVYDPSAATPTWTPVTTLPVPVFWAAATTGTDGRIYVVGGYPTTQGSQPGVNTVQVYDPVSQSWSIAAPISVPRYVLAAATGPDGRVYALPGASVSGTINVVEAYTPSANMWNTVASLNTARQAEAAVTSSDGRIFAIGGSDPQNDLFATVEAYSTGSNTWAYVASLNVARGSLAAAKGLDGKIYAFGGRTTSFGPLNTVEVYNSGASCNYAIAPASQSFSASGGNGSIVVTTTSGCPWRATSNADWITIGPLSPHIIIVGGSAFVSYSVASNPGGPRTGTISIASSTFTVTQAGIGTCSYTVNATSQPFSALGGTATIRVTAASGCAWTAVSHAPWVTILSGSSGSGNGSVKISVGPNSGAPQSGTVTVAGRTVTVNQGASACGATDVSDRVSVWQSTPLPTFPLFDEETRSAVLHNGSGQTIPGPIYLVTDGLPSAMTTLVSPAAGLTYCHSPNGSYLVLVSLNGLAPAESATIWLYFVPGAIAPSPYTTRVLSGTPSQ